jgi:hypothetical protein
MNSSLAPLQNYAPEDETRTMIWKMIQERGACLDSSRSMLESARTQKEIASKTVERLRHQLAEAERAEIVAIHSFEAAKKTVSDIEDTIAEHKALLHPLRYLPSDILREIFECCTEDDDHAGNMGVAIRLSSVCRSWRLIAHSLGSLWRHIDLSLWNPSDQDIFAAFMKRSTYYLNVRTEIDFDWGTTASASFSFTTFPFDRIRTLIIIIYSDVRISQEVSTMLHYLTRLKICAYLESEPAYMLRGDCLLHCQTLEELELEGIRILLNDDLMLPGLVRLSWKVHHDYDSLIPTFLKRLFGHVPHLESFSFSSSYPMDMEDVYLEDRNFQPLRELTSLRIECPSSRHAMAPFLEDSSLIPSLQHLTLASVDISDLLDSFVQYAEAVHLTKLTLEVTPYAEFGPDDDLVQRLMVLRHFRNLETLEVVAEGLPDWWLDPDYSEYFITCLCKVLSECTIYPIFPSLRNICLLRYSGASVDDIIEMVKARIVAARVSPEELAPLESVTFEDCEPLNVDQYRRLKAALGHDSS